MEQQHYSASVLRVCALVVWRQAVLRTYCACAYRCGDRQYCVRTAQVRTSRVAGWRQQARVPTPRATAATTTACSRFIKTSSLYMYSRHAHCERGRDQEQRSLAQDLGQERQGEQHSCVKIEEPQTQRARARTRTHTHAQPHTHARTIAHTTRAARSDQPNEVRGRDSALAPFTDSTQPCVR